MKELILFVCAFSNPQCEKYPEKIVVEYENNVLCHKVAQEAAAAILRQTDRLMSYTCDGNKYFPHPDPPYLPVPDDHTIG